MSNNGRQYRCEICQIFVPYDKHSIRAHENSQRHKNKKQRHLDDLNREAKKKRLEAEGAQPLIYGKSNEGQPKPPFKSDLGKRKTDPSKGPQEPKPDKKKKKKEEAGVSMRDYEVQSFVYGGGANRALEEQEEGGEDGDGSKKPKNPFGNVWRLDFDPVSGKVCFINNISGEKRFEKPIGLKLTEWEQKIWEDAEKDKTEAFRPNDEKTLNPEYRGDIGGWQVVDESEDFFKKNAAPAEAEEDEEEDEEEEVEDDGMTGKDMIDKWLDDTEGHTNERSKLKVKHEKLKHLIEHNIEIDSNIPKPTFQKGKTTEKVEAPTEVAPGESLFKKRKGKSSGVLVPLDDEAQ